MKRHAAAARRHLFLPADKTEKYFERKIIHAPARINYIIFYVFACVKMLIRTVQSIPMRQPLGTVVWFASQMKCLSSQLAFSQSNNRAQLYIAIASKRLRINKWAGGYQLWRERAFPMYYVHALALCLHGRVWSQVTVIQLCTGYRAVFDHTHTLDIDPSSNPPLNSPHVDTLSL